jgi:hypothetical protein
MFDQWPAQCAMRGRWRQASLLVEDRPVRLLRAMRRQVGGEGRPLEEVVPGQAVSGLHVERAGTAPQWVPPIEGRGAHRLAGENRTRRRRPRLSAGAAGYRIPVGFRISLVPRRPSRTSSDGGWAMSLMPRALVPRRPGRQFKRRRGMHTFAAMSEVI